MPVITLINEGQTIEITEGTNLRKALLKKGISPYVGKDKILNCLGNGLCGTCRVEVVDGKGAPPMSPLEEAALVGLVPFYARQIPKNVRLACRIGVTKDMAIKTYPVIALDWKLTKERLALLAIWTLFGGTFLVVMIRLLIEIATGR
ncbi:MAG: (2Fe-2S)-binding protein [Ignavibacteriae bacterium]|nr:(2Fe-2S)-binding protein [Ignavibacteria bacterium]MBI3365194.1 (2Fe-2S)-binding protein [Ignavibacteriota bacterium]